MEGKITEVKITESNHESTSLDRRLDRWFPPYEIDECHKLEPFSAVDDQSTQEGISDEFDIEGSDIESSEGTNEASDGDSGSDAGGDGDGDGGGGDGGDGGGGHA